MMQFALYKQKVNPDQPGLLLGFGNDRQSSEPFFGEPNLWLKLCWIRSGSEQLLILTLDTLYFSESIAQSLCRAALPYGITGEDIFFNASHTHSAPNISMPGWDKLDTAYMEKLEHHFTEGLKYCRDNFRDGYLSVEEIAPEADFFISRRKKTVTPRSPFRKLVERLPNREAPIDRNIRLIRLHTSDQHVAAVLYNFACHPVFNRNDSISSDFTGEISARLEAHLEQAMFLQGFCGDIRVAFTGRRNLKTLASLLTDSNYFKRNLGIALKLLFYGEIFIPYSTTHYSHYTDSLYQLIHAHLQTNATGISGDISIEKSTFEHTIHTQSGKNSCTFRTQVCRLGLLLFVSIPAEPDTCYYHLVKKNCGPLTFIPMGYGAGMIAYLPGAHEIAEGGYEVDSYIFYELDSPFSADDIAAYEKKLAEHARQFTGITAHQYDT